MDFPLLYHALAILHHIHLILHYLSDTSCMHKERPSFNLFVPLILDN